MALDIDSKNRGVRRPRRKLVRQLFPAFLLLIGISLASVAWLATESFKTFYLQKTYLDLKSDAQVVSDQILGQLTPLDSAGIQKTIQVLSAQINTRISIILPNGKIVADSEADPDTISEISRRPELEAAAGGKVG